MNEIRRMIQSKEPHMDKTALKYFTNYFYVLSQEKMVGVDLEKIIDNALSIAPKIIFYDKGDEMYEKLGPDSKGTRDVETKSIYVRNDLERPLKEIITYHEIHHVAQTNQESGCVGINQSENLGRMIMEAQTEYFAEKVYCRIHNVKFEEKEIPTQKLRMKSGGTIISPLHNYEMYDAYLSKLAIIFDVPKEFFVAINYLYENDMGLMQLKQRFIEAKAKYNLPFDSFEDFMYPGDYAYVVDLLSYIKNEDKELLLKGGETAGVRIYKKKGETLSQEKQLRYLDSFDNDCFHCLHKAKGRYEEFFRYIVKDSSREIIMQTL